MTGVNRFGGYPQMFLSKSQYLQKLFMTALMASAFCGTSWCFSSGDPFTIVPAGDPTYSELKQLARAGWLSEKDVSWASLTRYDVAKLILKAQRNSNEITLAQANITTPTPSSQVGTLEPLQETGTAPVTAAGPAKQSAAEMAVVRAQAAKSLHSLQEAYQYELKSLKEKLKTLQAEATELEAQQYNLRKKLMGFNQNPSISIHGLGLAYGYSQQFIGNYPVYINGNPGTRTTLGYLDLEPMGTISKEVSWDTILRLQSSLIPNDTPVFNLRRISLDFNPPWLSATLGDFDESYTPFTIWNRNSLDLAYAPEMWSRWDNRVKYENFFNDEPNWPFRGLRVGESVMWPDSGALDSLKASAFIHMIRNGYNYNSGSYFGSNQYTDWIFAGTAGLKSRKWYLGGTSLQLGLDSYGIILDEPLDTEQPGSPYDPENPATWAHQYLIGSLKPDIKVGLGDDCYVGGTGEYSYSNYQDDKRNPGRVIGDYAVMAGPYVKFGHSTLSVNYLNVGPYYYSPLAQTRQDGVSLVNGLTAPSMTSPDLFHPMLNYQNVLPDVPRPGDIFGFYDRTQDNTFPYGMATPNREGFGLETDLKLLWKETLWIKGSAYRVKEIFSNMVINNAQTGYIPVDLPFNTALIPIRNFTYVNAGPSFNLGPSLGWDRDLEIGSNIRYEQTTSDLGTLTSSWIIGGLRVDLLPVWEIAAAISQQNSKGTDAGYQYMDNDGVFHQTLWAHYSYVYDNKDLGHYAPFTVDGNIMSLRFSSIIKVNRNSNIYLDYDWTKGNLMPGNPAQGTVNNQFMELSYEIQF